MAKIWITDKKETGGRNWVCLTSVKNLQHKLTPAVCAWRAPPPAHYSDSNCVLFIIKSTSFYIRTHINNAILLQFF